MLQPIRRIVTGLNDRGQSAVIFEGTASSQGESPDWPGMGVTMLWRSDAVPVDNSGRSDAVAGPLSVMNSPRGVEFLIWQCPPLSDLARMTPEQRARALSPGGLIDADHVDPEHHPGMHATLTLDFLVVLSGEVTLILEDGEVTLHPGDTLVDRGVAHAWENRGSIPAVCAIVNVGTKPVTA